MSVHERWIAGRLNLPADALEQVAVDVRRDILTLLANAGSGHTGGSLSSADFLTAILFHEAAIDPGNPKWNDRDFWHVSHGHVSPLIYSVMAERGHFPLRDLLQFRTFEGHLQGHPSAHDTVGLEVSAGSLGQGLSITVGAALASRIDNNPRRCYVCMGDGEQQEGSVWEAALSASHYKLDNLLAIIDVNRLQIDGPTAEVMGIEPLVDKYAAFGWHVIDLDGHDMQSILNGFREARETKGKPTVILARTVMGKGWPEIEDDFTWHGLPPSKDQADRALQGLGANYGGWWARLEANGMKP